MNNELYPLRFKTQYKEKIWGGEKIKTILQKDFSPLENCGETWEISGVEHNESIIDNGFLAGNNLNEITEIYMGDLVGEKVYDKFGLEFPLLIKFIDANDYLSIQVHPDDKLAMKRHNSKGKTEMWYIVQADEGSRLISGFNIEITKEEYLDYFNQGKIKEILNYESVKAGDVFFMPAGRVHAIGPGILLAEIQQTSDVTYRIYDWDRKDNNGNNRELHTDLAVDAIDYKFHKKYKTDYQARKNNSSRIVTCPYFTANLIDFDKNVEREYFDLDSFVIYMCLEGEAVIEHTRGKETIKTGETILLPAIFERVNLKPMRNSKILEIFIDIE